MVGFVSGTDHPLKLPYGLVELDGLLHVPETYQGLVIFVHGSGSGRFSPRNQAIAKNLQQNGMATLLFDLLTADEDEIDNKTREYRFDIPLLAKRLEAVTKWVLNNPIFHHSPIGYFGASTGGGAALVSASQFPKEVKAVVSRGGRPDLAMEVLSKVRAATLLLVGGKDEQVIELNQLAYEELKCEKELIIIPGATHLFEEPGKLEEVANLSTSWFKKYLK